jgi:hypothetical protein
MRVAIGALIGIAIMGIGNQAFGQDEIHMRPGVRIGLTSDPDQLVLGGFLSLDDLMTKNLRLEPSLLAGIGDDFTTVRLCGHFKYLFPDVAEDFVFYPIGGISIWYWNWDYERYGTKLSDSGTEVGLDIGGGASYEDFSLDVTLGIGDTPDFLVTFSYRFDTLIF